MQQQKILLVLLNSNGDCLYGTVIARQIKEADYPGCYLTWAVNNRCKQAILHNPYIDEIWEIPTEKSLTSTKEWNALVKLAEAKKNAGEFTQIFYLQIIGKNVMNLDGNIRASIYRNYPHPVSVSQQPVLRLTDVEIANTAAFSRKHQLASYRQVVLIECGPDSFTSSLNAASAYAFATNITEKNKDIAFILSSNKKVEHPTPQIIDGSTLSFRENAALTVYCTLFIGCSSGISWISTSSAAKPLPKIIILNDKAVLNSSMVDDHAMAGLPVNDIIELNESADIMERLSTCFEQAVNGKFNEARAIYHQPFKRSNFKYLYHVAQNSFANWNFVFPFIAFIRAIRKDGFHVNALYNLIKSYIKLPVYAIGSIFRKK
jgi:hypothetical protein